ncbi:hypothetical protein PENTCL1PPCAC_16255, partial [Pristionchus entomophagus]
DDLLTSKITNFIIFADCLMSLCTLPLTIVILYVLLRDREHSGSFFTIYKVGLVYDIVTLICVHIICVIPTRGFLINDDVAESELYLNTADSFATRIFWLETFVCDFASCLFMLALYGFVIWRYRAKIHGPREKQERVDNKRAFNLLCIAVTVLVVETTGPVFQRST